jgi:hypothetical protein
MGRGIAPLERNHGFLTARDEAEDGEAVDVPASKQLRRSHLGSGVARLLAIEDQQRVWRQRAAMAPWPIAGK